MINNLKGSSVSVHERSVRIFAIEMYKVSNSFTPPHINEVFEVSNKSPYNLKRNSRFSWPYQNQYITKLKVFSI